MGCEIGKSFLVQFLLHLFSTVLNKHFLSYDDSGKIDVFPNGIELCVCAHHVETTKNGNSTEQTLLSGDDDDDGWQMERKVSISLLFAFAKWRLIEAISSTHLNLNVLSSY